MAVDHSAHSHASQTQLASSPRTELTVDGMNCGHCVQTVRNALSEVPGVADVEVSLDESRASVRWKPNAPGDVSALVSAVEGAGYKARPAVAEAKKPSRWSPLTGWRFNALVGTICTLPLIVGEWVFGWGMQNWFHWVSFGLALPVQTVCGARFYRGAWNQLKSGTSSMDTLVALGSTTAFAYSVWGLFSGRAGHLYFMEAAAIITLISIGHWLEARVSAQSESALRALLHLAPQMARRHNPDGSETEVPVAELRPGDTVSLRPGDRVPTDGELIRGHSSVDESMLTGESLPVEKQIGGQLYAGTTNINGQLLMRVTATGEGTALAHIIAAVQRAQNSRANIQRLADKVSSIFVPAAILVALAAGIWWGFFPEQARATSEYLSRYLWNPHIPVGAVAAAIISAAAVLIVACPCAMGLATPAAIMAGTNVAASRGILIRDGVALERAGQITAVVFDKTGTLTRGQPAVVETWAAGESSDASHDNAKQSAMTLAAALARGSKHPLSQAVAKLSSADPQFVNWQEVRGAGLQAQTKTPSDRVVRLGSLKWLEQCGVNISVGAPFADKWMDRGATILGLSSDKTLSALIALQDTVKPGADGVVDRIHRNGLSSFLITGDNHRTAKAIAEQVGIPPENVFAEVRPEQKASLVKEMQARGQRVAFVGDGINDAPALQQANLGIAVSQASDVANEAADIILLKSEIQAIPEAIDLARATLRTIKQNLFWAFFYNTLAIPLAALGFLSPVLCAAAMGLSDLVVIGNALRLRSWRSKA